MWLLWRKINPACGFVADVLKGGGDLRRRRRPAGWGGGDGTLDDVLNFWHFAIVVGALGIESIVGKQEKEESDDLVAFAQS